MLHKDLIEIMSTSEIIDLAYSEYSPFFDASAQFEIRHSSDGCGTLLEFHVVDNKNASFLREKLPPFYNGARTVVMYTNDEEASGD